MSAATLDFLKEELRQVEEELCRLGGLLPCPVELPALLHRQACLRDLLREVEPAAEPPPSETWLG
jgi:hypothetical protein